MSKYFFDLEADGLLLDATKVHCIVLKDLETEEVFAYRPDQILEGVRHIQEAGELIGHNISLYDLPLLQRLYGLDWSEIKVKDTMIWSRLLDPDRLGGHSLKAWGKTLGNWKGDFTDFSQFTDEMLNYCIQDVEVTETLHDHLLVKIGEFSEALDLEHKFAYIISQQILNGFTLDINFTNQLLKELQDEYQRLNIKLIKTLPKERIDGFYNGVRRDRRLIDEDETGFRYTTPQTGIIKERKWEYRDANPRSRQQLVKFFMDKYNWRPTKKTDKGEWAIDEAVLETMPYPEAQDIKQMFYVNKKIAMINGPGGWLKFLREGKVHGGMITTGAVTGRCRHSKPNMANISRKRGIEMREAWIPREGWDLVSCDADQLEARCLAHFTTPYDDGELKWLILEGDLHAQNQQYCNLQSRDTAKTLLYGMMYGAGDIKLGHIVTSENPTFSRSRAELKLRGRRARKAIGDSMYGLRTLSKVITQTLVQRPYLLGLDGRPLHIRSPHAALNTLLQSAGAVIMKQCLNFFWDLCKENQYVHGLDFGLVANVHDECVIECRPEISKKIVQLFSEAMLLTEKHFNFKCPLTAEGKVGPNWRAIH